MTDPAVSVDLRDGIAEIILDRPEHDNRMSPQMLEELCAAVKALINSSDCSVMTLRGRGANFSGGLDLPAIRKARDGFDLAALRLDLHASLLDSPKPVVAVLTGYAYAAGAALALCADFLIAEYNAVLHVPEVNFDSVAFAPWLNVALLALKHTESLATRVALTGQPVDGVELARLGIATESVPPGSGAAAGHALAALLARNNRDVVAVTKALITRSRGGLSGRQYLQSQLEQRRLLSATFERSSDKR